MDIDATASIVLEALEVDVRRGATLLAEFASRHANDRELVYRAVLLKRELSRSSEPPTAAQSARGIALLDALIADQNASPSAARRVVVAEEAQARALQIKIPNAVVLDCAALTRRYRRGGFSLKDISFRIRFGEILGVVGRNGYGKTTLFRMIVGELRPDSGGIRFPTIQPDTASVRWSRVRPHIAYVPQELPEWHGGLQSNLHYEAAVHGIRGAANLREVEFIIERFGLGDQLDRRWNELSGGFKLRFALARALVRKPKLLVLDEPLANLDFMTQQVVLNDLRHLTDSLRYPLAVLVSSQHIHEIEEVSDKLLLLESGQLRFFGPVGAVGADRRVNRYEISGNVELADLEDAFSEREYRSVYYTGVAYVLTTDTAVTSKDVLRRLLDRRVPVTYFRDISRSAKSLLQADAGES